MIVPAHSRAAMLTSVMESANLAVFVAANDERGVGCVIVKASSLDNLGEIITFIWYSLRATYVQPHFFKDLFAFGLEKLL